MRMFVIFVKTSFFERPAENLYFRLLIVIDIRFTEIHSSYNANACYIFVKASYLGDLHRIYISDYLYEFIFVSQKYIVVIMQMLVIYL